MKKKPRNIIRSFTSLDALGETRGLNVSLRSVDFIASTETEDDHGTVIEQSWDLSRYKRNSVVLYSHNSEAGGLFGGGTPGDSIPIARAENVRVEEGKLKCTVVFPVEGEDELSDRVWRAVCSKRLNAMSVGFKPGKVKREELPDGRMRYRLSNNVLYELSICPMGSNPETVAERSLLARAALARMAEDGGCCDDDCDGPEACEDELCVCACHGDRTKKKAPSGVTEKRTMLEILARMLGCTADEASIVAAVESLKTRAAEPKTEMLAAIEAPSFDEERAALTGRVESAQASLRSLVESLGLTTDAPVADASRAIATLTARAAKADELEPLVADQAKRIAEHEAETAAREVEFLIARGKSYDFSYDERSRKALAAYRKADPKGFAEDHKAALDGLRAFDDPKLFERVAGGETGTAAASTEEQASRATAPTYGEPSANDALRAKADEFQKAAAEKGSPISRSVALEMAARAL